MAQFANPGAGPFRTIATLATELAREHGVFRTAQALRLDSSKLMKRLRANVPETKPASAPQAVR
jgi:hypothetical protein